MAGMRDIVVHQYFGVDLEAVWQAATVDFPDLKGEDTEDSRRAQ
jgi:uncharacterized protein with HEPN domain